MSARLYVENLPLDVREEEVEDLFRAVSMTT
jgi:RNA recognition motif-containing protein